MAGLAGIIYPDVYQVHLFLEPMLKVLGGRCRFPDEDTYTYKNIRIGVIGGFLSNNRGRTTTATLDGTIYNRHSLIKELKVKGYPFQSESPEEMIVHAYDEWGEEFASKLDGDFAIALFDRKREKLMLVRDRFGIRPLYWYHSQDHFVFASELKALLATGLIPQNPDKSGLATYLSLGYFPQDMTPVQDINKLLPAHQLIFNLHGGMSIHSYWSYGALLSEEPVEASADELHSRLVRAVERRIENNEKLGCLISGGIGSGSVAALLRPHNPEAFTVSFQGETEEDLSTAYECTKALEIPHHAARLTPENFLDDLVPIIWCLDEPQSDPNCIATWKLAELASQAGVETVFSGMGSDELLAGHGRYTLEERSSPFINRIEEFGYALLKKLAVPISHYFAPNLAFQMLRTTTSDPDHLDYLKSLALFNEKEISRAAPPLSKLYDPDIFLHKFYRLQDVPNDVNAFTYLDVKTRLPDLYISQYEKLTTAHGLNWRSPFFDPDVVDYLARIAPPPDLAMKETAKLLKEAMQKTLPETLLSRPKCSRKQFLNSWVEPSTIIPLFQALETGTLVESGLVSPKWIRKVTSSPHSCQTYFAQLWTILTLEVWVQLFINFPIEPACPSLSVQQLLKRS